jgi:hypothetical protein
MAVDFFVGFRRNKNAWSEKHNDVVWDTILWRLQLSNFISHIVFVRIQYHVVKK